jgi:hypothetical protein
MPKTNIFELSAQLYPDAKGIRKIQKKGRFYYWALTNAPAVNAMATLFSRENIKPILINNPKTIEKALKPYICVNWSKAERVKHVIQHFQFMDETFAEHAKTVISTAGTTILEFDSLSGQTYRVQLYQGTSREGGIGISLVNDQGKRVYALSCNISGSDTKTLYIGMLQGASENLEDRHNVIKELTKSLHGLRPKSLLVEMALMFSRILGISEVRAISNKGHIYQSLRYFAKRKRVTFDYDGLWNDFSATKLDPYLFALSVSTPRKDPQTLKKTKRKMYTKRYEWLDETEILMAKNLARYMAPASSEKVT